MVTLSRLGRDGNSAGLEMTSIFSHAWKSGALYASNFSNDNKSKKYICNRINDH
jgi:hypothetical protein